VPEADWEFPAAGGHRQDEPPREKRRMDWSEYLDDTVERRGGHEVADSPDHGMLESCSM
jgi:hypothetical protein